MIKSILASENFKLFSATLRVKNPIEASVLGTFAAFSVTTHLGSTFVIGLILMAVLAFSGMILSGLRNIMPAHSRHFVEIAVIATLVTLSDLILGVISPTIETQLFVFVGLIATVSVMLNRNHTFSLENTPSLSFWEGLGRGFGYLILLSIVAFFREFLGYGTFFGWHVIPQFFYASGYKNMVIMLNPIGALLVIGLLVWLQNTLLKKSEQ